MSLSSREETLKDAHEWAVIMTTGTLFPVIGPEAIRRISVPVLMFSRESPTPFSALSNESCRAYCATVAWSYSQMTDI